MLGGAAMKSLGCPSFEVGVSHPETLLSAGPLTAALGVAVRTRRSVVEVTHLRALLDDVVLSRPSQLAVGTAFCGAPAVAAVLRIALNKAPQLQQRYEVFLELADAEVDEIVRTRLLAACQRLRRRLPLARAEYSLREGLVGLGACLLQRTDAARDPLLVAVVAYLVALVSSGEETGRPGWWVHHSPLDDLAQKEEWPDGHACFTLLDGSAGIMALLALARLRGIRVAHDDEALQTLTDFHGAHERVDRHGRPWYPEVVTDPSPDLNSALDHDGDVQGPGVCGTLGIARATQLAGQALDDPALCRGAVAAAHAALTRDAGLFETGGICHGPHGAAIAALRMAADEADACALAETAGSLLSAVDSDACVGDPHGGLLDGSVGERITRPPGRSRIALPAPAPVSWDSLLLLAPSWSPPRLPAPVPAVL